MRYRGLTVLLLAACGVAQLASAQALPDKAAAPANKPADSVVQVKLGASTVELTGLWKFHPGDDMAWADPGFDDSAWKTIDLTPPEGSADATLGTSGYIPGWTAQGYPRLTGYAWYRLHVNVEDASRSLALKMPDSADDAYQVFANGQKIGEFGEFSGHHVRAYSTLPRGFPLPKGMRNGPLVIAVRMWMDSATPFNSPDAGGMHFPPELGFASVVRTQIQLDWDDISHEVGAGFVEMMIVFMALLMAVTLFWLDRDEKAYLWLAIVCGVTLLGNATVLLVNFTTFIGQTWGLILTDVVLTPLRIGLWVLFWGYWFRLWRLRTLHKAVWPLVALLGAGAAMLRPPLFGRFVPVGAATYLVPTLLVLKLILGALLFVIAYYGFKRHKAESVMALVAMTLVAMANYQHELRLIHIKMTALVNGYVVSLGTTATILSVLIITIMLQRRFVHSERLKEQWKLDIQQAREIQQLLIPTRLPKIKGLVIDSEYRPAREVGGDFFQIVPGDAPGTALIVVGDVTGKGMQAGMLVALIVGAIRTAAQHASDPARILNLVNDELCEREHASATCMILQIGQNGEVRVANAGQLPPFLNGVEMEIQGALPLGMIGGMEYAVETFHLAEGDSLMLMSDGVAEAQNSDGELFGFDRVNVLVSRHMTPAEIASAAQEFGQEDDILVLRIRREVTPEPASLAEPQLAAM
jgi:hypothetical protein